MCIKLFVKNSLWTNWFIEFLSYFFPVELRRRQKIEHDSSRSPTKESKWNLYAIDTLLYGYRVLHLFLFTLCLPKKIDSVDSNSCRSSAQNLQGRREHMIFFHYSARLSATATTTKNKKKTSVSIVECLKIKLSVPHARDHHSVEFSALEMASARIFHFIISTHHALAIECGKRTHRRRRKHRIIEQLTNSLSTICQSPQKWLFINDCSVPSIRHMSTRKWHTAYITQWRYKNDSSRYITVTQCGGSTRKKRFSRLINSSNSSRNWYFFWQQ